MDNKIKSVLFILVLGSICVGLLLAIKSYTYPIISEYEEKTFKTTILDAAAMDYSDEDFQEVFNMSIRKIVKESVTYYLSPDNFYIFEFRGRGLWGPISGAITLYPDLETIKSIKIISQEETPGLGARIEEESFLNQFIKKKVSPKLNIVLRKKSTEDNEIDAISGASMTSVALIDMINEAVNELRTAIEK